MRRRSDHRDSGIRQHIARWRNARVQRELTFDKLLTGGDGGAAELLAWVVAMGAAAELGQPRAESIFYVPSVPMRCGMGGSYWQLP